jgi:hypothetical protein
MAFMQRQVEYGRWVEVDGPQGIEVIPADLVGEVTTYRGELAPVPDELSDYCENRQAWSIGVREGWGARLSAPGYLDCTPWSVFDTEAEAKAHLAEQEDE